MKITARELAMLTGGSIEGDGEAELSGFAKIEEAGKGDLTFLANEKYTPYIYNTEATAVLVRDSFVAEHPVKATLIRVADPYATLGLLLRHVASMAPRPQGVEQPSFVAEGVELPEQHYIGAFAYIGKGVRLGSNVSIYPQAYVGDGCQIGDDTTIYAGAKIYPGCSVGKRCVIHSGAVIGADGFGFAPNGEHYEKIPQLGNVIIEDDVEIGANTTVDRATFGSTRVGAGTKLDNLIQVAHNVVIGRDNVFAAQTGIAGSVKIGDSNRIGGQVGFAGHLAIGSKNEIGAQSGLHKNVGDGERLMGTPAVPAAKFARTQFYIARLSEIFNKKQDNSK